MIDSIHLTLQAGPAVPLTVPRSVIDALVSVQITDTAAPGAQSGFRLVFDLDKQSPLQTIFLLSGSSLPPLFRVLLTATLKGQTEVLMDGVVTKVDVGQGGGGRATLTVTGLDLSAVMDWIDFSGIPYPAMPAEARVLLILAKYAFLGLVPMVIPSPLIDVPIPIEQIPRHQGTDLAYVRGLADEVGYVFYVKPGPLPGMSVGYWGPDIKIGIPQPALSTEMDGRTNVNSLTFSFDGEKATLPLLYIHNKETKAPILIPVPPITPLNPPLGAIPPFPKRIVPIHETAKYGPLRAAMVGLGKAARAADTVGAQGSLDVVRYGRILRARNLVGVRGGGPAFDGLFYVQSVEHDLKRGHYQQNFTLSRNGLLPTIPKVAV